MVCAFLKFSKFSIVRFLQRVREITRLRCKAPIDCMSTLHPHGKFVARLAEVAKSNPRSKNREHTYEVLGDEMKPKIKYRNVTY